MHFWNIWHKKIWTNKYVSYLLHIIIERPELVEHYLVSVRHDSHGTLWKCFPTKEKVKKLINLKGWKYYHKQYNQKRISSRGAQFAPREDKVNINESMLAKNFPLYVDISLWGARREKKTFSKFWHTERINF